MDPAAAAPWLPCPDCPNAPFDICVICDRWLMMALVNMRTHLPPARIGCQCSGCLADFAYRLRHAPHTEWPAGVAAAPGGVIVTRAKLVALFGQADLATVPTEALRRVVSCFHYRQALTRVRCTCIDWTSATAADAFASHSMRTCRAVECPDCSFLICPSEEMGHFSAAGCPICNFQPEPAVSSSASTVRVT